MTQPPLLLLHGALGSRELFAPLVPFLEPYCAVHCFDFAGHGATPLRGAGFSMAGLVAEVRAYLDDYAIPQARLFGYSMGGYVACALAQADPERVVGIVTLGTKFYWDAATAERETGRLDPQKIAAKVPHFAQALAARHTAIGWEAVLGHTRDLLTALGASGGLRPVDLAGLGCRVRICQGDRDPTVPLPESAEVARALPHGELEVLPATPHEFERVAPARLAYTLREFFEF